MTAAVRLFSYSGVNAVPVASNANLMLAHTSYQFPGRYLAKEQLSASTGTAVSSAAALSASTHCRLLRMQVEPGKAVHVEVVPPGVAGIVATTGSPIYTGNEVLDWGPEWTVSILEATLPS
jgi:hypothetical protein